jgi:hypothetical protein
MINRKIIINESERNRIKNLYETPVSVDFVISNWLSPDEKYVIFLDELYDIESKTKLGNIWENFDNFKFFLKHSFEVSTTIPQQIKEDVLKTLNSFLLTESTQNLTSLKPIFKELLKEDKDWGVLGDLGNWAKETATNTVKGVTDFVKTGYEGLKKLGIAISEGDWMKIVDLLKKGALYVARSIRSALYSPVGLILDAILMASGVGVFFKALPWAIVVALDIYELTTGNYEDPDLSMGWRFFFFGIDIIGLVSSGVFAKSSRTMVLNAISRFGKSEKGLQAAVQNTPKLKSFLSKILENSPKVEGLIKQAISQVKGKSPMFFKFFSSIIGGIGKFIGKLVSFISKLLTVPGKLTTKLGGGLKTAAAANTLGLVAGVGTYEKGNERKQNKEMSDAILGSNIEPDFSDIKW